MDLYAKYYQCFQHTKAAMEEADEPPFGLSEVHIFLKFETFKRRLEKVSLTAIIISPREKIVLFKLIIVLMWEMA